MTQEKRTPGWMKPVLVGAVGLLVLVALGLLIKSFLGKADGPKQRQVQQIALLKPPPPPPPPPKNEPPPPEVKREEVKIPDPAPEQPQQAQDDAPPPGQDLGVDADGGAGSDGFGLVGRKGGRDLLAGGGGFGGFGSIVQRHLQDTFARDKKLRSADYRVVVKLWFARDGRLQRYELAGTTGNAETDQNLKTALADVGRFPESPPEGMPQPLKIRITSRGAG